MNHAIENYLEHLKLANASKNTIRAYKGTLANFVLTTRTLLITDFDVDHIECYLAELRKRNLAKRSVYRDLAVVKSLGRWMLDEGLIKDNPAEAFKGPRLPQRVKRVATPAEVLKIIESPIRTSFPERDRLMLELAYGSGLRCEETASVQLSDFAEPDLLLVSKGKGSKERYVLITDYAKESLALYLEKRAQILTARVNKGDTREVTALFFGLNGTQVEALTSRSVYRIIAGIAGDAGIDWLGPHDLRRAFATHMDQLGAQHIVIQKLLGHSKLSVTEIYIAAGSPQRLKLAYDAARAKGAIREAAHSVHGG